MVSKYTPILKWRMGEYQALSRLKVKKNTFTPLFVIPPVEYDFDKEQLAKSANDHVLDKPQKICDKWGAERASFMLHESLYEEVMNSGINVYDFFLDKFEDLELIIWPAITPKFSDDIIDRSISYSKRRDLGILIRIDFENLLEIDLNEYLKVFSKKYSFPYESIEIILDFGGEANFDPIESTFEIIESIIEDVEDNEFLKSIYISGHSLDLKIKPNTTVIQSRSEWEFFEYFYNQKKKTIKNIGFSDYVAETPEFNSMDMRLTKPSARLIYSNSMGWIVVKGSSFRDNPKQMHKLCHDFIYKTPHFFNKNYSNGDAKIYDCAHKTCSNGNLTVWKEAATSHHITFVVDQIDQLLV